MRGHVFLKLIQLSLLPAFLWMLTAVCQEALFLTTEG